jgi:SAM-dependent methyltransferase
MMPQLERERVAIPLEQYMDHLAPDLLRHRWFRSVATSWDYEVTRLSLLEALVPGPDDRILEIGCGPGTWTREVAARCEWLTAVDLSGKMIAEARKNVQGLPVQFIHSDFLQSRTEGKFDKVFSVRAMEYIPDKAQLAGKIAELLAPGGRVVLTTKSRFSMWRGRNRLVYGAWPKLSHSNGAPGGLRRDGKLGFSQSFSSPGDIARMFAPYGIVPVQVRPAVLRPPVFKNGFDEFPVIPNTLAPQLLDLLKYVWGAASRLPGWLAFFPLFFSESYCITLESSGSIETRDR